MIFIIRKSFLNHDDFCSATYPFRQSAVFQPFQGVLQGSGKETINHSLLLVSSGIQLFRERLSEKVHATIPESIVRSFEFTVIQRNSKEWHERPWIYVCDC